MDKPKDILGVELERLLEDYKFKISKIELEIPQAPLPEKREAEPLRFTREAVLPDVAEPPSALEAFRKALEEENRPPTPPPPEQPPPTVSVERGAPMEAIPRAPEPSNEKAETLPPDKIAQPSRIPFKKPLRIALAASAVLVTGLAIKLVRFGPVHQALPLPPLPWVGLTGAGDKLFMLDAGKRQLFSFSLADAKLREEGKFGNGAPRGLAWGQNVFWSSDPSLGVIYQHNSDDTRSIKRAYANINRKPGSLCLRDEFLWVADASAPLVYQYLITSSLTGTTLTPVKQYTLNGSPAAGLHCSAVNWLWVLDAEKRKVSRYRLELNNMVLMDYFPLSPWVEPSARLLGLHADESFLWVQTLDSAALHRFDLGRIAWSRR